MPALKGYFFLHVGLIKQFLKDTYWGRLDFLIFGTWQNCMHGKYVQRLLAGPCIELNYYCGGRTGRKEARCETVSVYEKVWSERKKLDGKCMALHE